MTETSSPAAETKPMSQPMSQHDAAVAAYASVAEIPALEMNDRNRLGFHIYLYLIGEIETVGAAVHESQARLHVPNAEAAKTVIAALSAQGITAV